MADEELTKEKEQEQQTGDGEAAVSDDFEAAFNEFAGSDSEEDRSQPGDFHVPETEQKQESESKEAKPEEGAAPAVEQDSQKANEGKVADDDENDPEKLKARMKSWDGRLKASMQREKDLAKENEALKQQIAQREAGQQARDQAEGQTETQQKKSMEERYNVWVEAYGEDYAKELFGLAEEIKKDLRSEFQESLKPVQTQQQQIAQSQQKSAAESHFAALREHHSDFEELITSGKVLEWIDEQPEYLKVGMLKAYHNEDGLGSVENQAKLLTSFKEARGLIQPSNKEPPSDPKASVRKAAEAAGAVPSRRRATPPQARPSDDDFEGNFNYFAKQIEQESARG